MDTNVSIILGRPFLAIGRVIVDVERGDLRFKVNDKEVLFNICRTLKPPKDLQMVSVIDRS